MGLLNVSLCEWLAQQELFVQLAAKKILEQEHITETDLQELKNTAQKESKDRKTHPDFIFSENTPKKTLKLISISTIEGVNALSPQKPLTFGDSDVTVIFGNNGSGKTSYVRLLKHISKSPLAGELHPNVYAEKSDLEQKAQITFEKNGEQVVHNWNKSETFVALSQINIFDAHYASVQLSGKNSLSYKPPLIKFLNSLIFLIKKISRSTDQTIQEIEAKKKEIIKNSMSENFTKRFNNELKNLGASNIKVEAHPDATGRYQLRLSAETQPPIHEVLSEGEIRVINIAAFLAENVNNQVPTPFIFDDPMSSLDHIYEEQVVKRLVQLAQYHQVIIFTHRLSFLELSQSAAAKRQIKLNVVRIRATTWGTGEPGQFILSQSDIKSGLSTLINNRIAELKKLMDSEQTELAEIVIKSMCSDFRILIEKAIENDLLCGVVQRFQRAVHTLRIKELSKIKYTDCDFLDSLMTKYSFWEHSQSAETPQNFPTADELLQDFNTLKDWRQEFSTRKISSE